MALKRPLVHTTGSIRELALADTLDPETMPGKENALGNPDVSGKSLVSTDAGVRSWAAKEADLGVPSVSGYMLTSTTGGARSWVAPPAVVELAQLHAIALYF